MQKPDTVGDEGGEEKQRWQRELKPILFRIQLGVGKRGKEKKSARRIGYKQWSRKKEGRSKEKRNSKENRDARGEKREYTRVERTET